MISIGSLFSGIGGLDLACEQFFGAETVWQVEYDENPSTILARHWNVPNYGDVKSVDWSAVQPVDILTAGYPCQPFSHAGQRQGENDERHLWPHVRNALRVLRPRLAVFENVSGHLSLGFDRVLADLAQEGFNAEWVVVRASDVGAPHQRARLFILAYPGSERHGSEQDTGMVGRLDGTNASQSLQRERPRQESEHRDDAIVAYPTNDDGWPGQQRWEGTSVRPQGNDQSPRLDPINASAAYPNITSGQTWVNSRYDGQSVWPQPVGFAPSFAWGDYEPAIRRWERLTRPAPSPIDDKKRLAPEFVEWMMGYPEGWVDGISRTAQLKALGNAVVPAQAIYALSVLCGYNVTQQRSSELLPTPKARDAAGPGRHGNGGLDLPTTVSEITA